MSGQVSLDLWCYFPNGDVKQFNKFSVNELIMSDLNDEQFGELRAKYPSISVDSKDQTQRVQVPNFSQMDWTISPPRFDMLEKLFSRKDTKFFLTINWNFHR